MSNYVLYKFKIVIIESFANNVHGSNQGCKPLDSEFWYLRLAKLIFFRCFTKKTKTLLTTLLFFHVRININKTQNMIPIFKCKFV